MAGLHLGVEDTVVEAGAMDLLVLLVEDTNPARLVPPLRVPSSKVHVKPEGTHLQLLGPQAGRLLCQYPQENLRVCGL